MLLKNIECESKEQNTPKKHIHSILEGNNNNEKRIIDINMNSYERKRERLLKDIRLGMRLLECRVRDTQ